MAKIRLPLPNYPQATEGNRDSYSLKGADFKSGFIFFLKWRRATPDINKVRVLPSNRRVFPTFPLLNLRVLAPKLRNEPNLIDSIAKKVARLKNRKCLSIETNELWLHCWKYINPYFKMTSRKFSMYWSKNQSFPTLFWKSSDKPT